MSDVFSRLVDRAWDRGPRVRPQIAPRFAPRTEALPVEEIEVDAAPLVAATSSPAPSRSSSIGTAQERGTRPDVQARLGGVDPVPRSTTTTSDPAIERRESAREPERAAPVADRSIEHVTTRSVEQTRWVESAPPVAAQPAALRAQDVAALRPAGPPGSEATGQEGVRPRPLDAMTPEAKGSPSEPVRISIGRIDVRATVTAAPVARPQPKHTPMGLEDYLRRRDQGR